VAKSARKNVATATRDARRLRTVAGYFSNPDDGDLDRLIYERIRLGIMSALSVNDRMSFGELKELLNASDGNLSTHARKLEDAGYISCRKTFSGRVPRTEFRITTKGRRVFARQLEHLEALITAAKGK
jgi:DNA-binding MarR family transcriptional regulator